MKNKLFVLTNERISFKEGNFYCDNIDIKNTPEGLSKKLEVNLLGRKSKKTRSHEVKLKKIRIFSNIFSYIFYIIKSLNEKNSKYLIISITPYTFMASIIVSEMFFLFLIIFNKEKTPFSILNLPTYNNLKFLISLILGFFSQTVSI